MLQRIKENIVQIPRYFLEAVRIYPIEIGLFVYSFIGLLLLHEEILTEPHYLRWAPLFVAISYACNQLISKRQRWIYFVSWIPLVPLSFLPDLENWFTAPQGIISMFILAPLLILLCRRHFENRQFINETLSYANTTIRSLILSSALFGSFCAIFYSTIYIFGIDLESTVKESFVYYAAITCYVLIAPTWLLGMLRSAFKTTYSANKFQDTLLNIILTPALLIYTAMLYLYFARIIVIWELPKGGVAYLVFGFMVCAFIVKAMQQFVRTRKYDWFFNRFSWISLPALLMFWVGTSRRIEEYGLTVDRIYLVVSGIIMTICVALFLFRRWGRFSYVLLFAFTLFGMLAYIPALSPEEIAIKSQVERVRSLAKEVNMLNDKNQLALTAFDKIDTTHFNAYHEIYQSLNYISNQKIARLSDLGVKKTAEYLTIFPIEHRDRIKYGSPYWENTYNNTFIFGDQLSVSRIDSLKGYSWIYLPNNDYDKQDNYISTNHIDGRIIIRRGETILFEENAETVIRGIFQNAGYQRVEEITKADVKKINDKGLIYYSDSAILRLHSFSVKIGAQKLEVIFASTGYLLLKERL